MKNNRRERQLTEARAAVLQTLTEQPDPVGIEALARVTGRHPNTLREQIKWLLDNGLVRRHRVPVPARGRPSWHYEAVGPTPGAQDYAELAAVLAWSLSQRSIPPHQDALEAGRHWGRKLCAERGAEPAPSARAGRRRTVELLDQLGYGCDPDARDDRVLLTRCPLLQAAHEFPEIVCQVHLGLVQSALSAFGADPERAQLTPFSGPRECRLRLFATTSPAAAPR